MQYGSIDSFGQAIRGYDVVYLAKNGLIQIEIMQALCRLYVGFMQEENYKDYRKYNGFKHFYVGMQAKYENNFVILQNQTCNNQKK